MKKHFKIFICLFLCISVLGLTTKASTVIESSGITPRANVNTTVTVYDIPLFNYKYTVALRFNVVVDGRSGVLYGSEFKEIARCTMPDWYIAHKLEAMDRVVNKTSDYSYRHLVYLHSNVTKESEQIWVTVNSPGPLGREFSPYISEISITDPNDANKIVTTLTYDNKGHLSSVVDFTE